MNTLKFLLVLCTCENTDVFITLDENIYGIHSKSVNILYIFLCLFYISIFIFYFRPKILYCDTFYWILKVMANIKNKH